MLTHGCASAAGGQWQTALELFRAMDGMGLPRDAITYSSVISALAKGKQWAHALQARHPPLFCNLVFYTVGRQWAHVLQTRHQMSLPCFRRLSCQATCRWAGMQAEVGMHSERTLPQSHPCFPFHVCAAGHIQAHMQTHGVKVTNAPA